MSTQTTACCFFVLLAFCCCVEEPIQSYDYDGESGDYDEDRRFEEGRSEIASQGDDADADEEDSSAEGQDPDGNVDFEWYWMQIEPKYNMVRLWFNLSKNGQPVEVDKEMITLFENGREVTVHEGQLDLVPRRLNLVRLHLLIDGSISAMAVEGTRNALMEAARSLVEIVIGQYGGEVKVTVFDAMGRYDLFAGYTHDRDLVGDALNELALQDPPEYPGCEMYGAIDWAATAMEEAVENHHGLRFYTSVVALSDSEGITGLYDMTDIRKHVESAESAGVRFAVFARYRSAQQRYDLNTLFPNGENERFFLVENLSRFQDTVDSGTPLLFSGIAGDRLLAYCTGYQGGNPLLSIRIQLDGEDGVLVEELGNLPITGKPLMPCKPIIFDPCLHAEEECGSMTNTGDTNIVYHEERIQVEPDFLYYCGCTSGSCQDGVCTCSSQDPGCLSDGDIDTDIDFDAAEFDDDSEIADRENDASEDESDSSDTCDSPNEFFCSDNLQAVYFCKSNGHRIPFKICSPPSICRIDNTGLGDCATP